MILDLNDFEIRVLGMFAWRNCKWLSLPDLTTEAREAVDYLVLAGLLERQRRSFSRSGGPPAWLDRWRLTEAGVEAVAALGASDMASKPLDEPKPTEGPKRIGVGSLVRHRHHGEGLVIRHFMWDGDWGGFEVQLLKPSETGPASSISTFSDRADAFENLS